jgi:NAD dependent epimerase/dehydratase
METVLVTGADGFIGSHLVERLLLNGNKVKALCLYNSFGSYGWLDPNLKSDSLEIVLGDVRDYSICEEITKDVHTVFHLAALIGIPYSYKAVDSYIATNVMGTSNMCKAALNGRVNHFITMSTSEVYGSALHVPIDESHPLQAQSPYSASKIAADALATSYAKSFDLPLTIARPFNTYGPRQSRRAFIPSVAAQIISGVSEIQVGSLDTTRDLTFVTDTADALISIMKAGPQSGEAINIGSQVEFSISSIIDLMQEISGTEIPVVVDSQRIRPTKSEVQRLVCNNQKLMNLTGFKPSIELKLGLKLTLDWIRENLNNSAYKESSYQV